MYGRILIDNLFIEVYKAFPASVMGRFDIDPTNYIILPSSALKKLSNMKNFENSINPVLFRILNINLGIFTHCGVLDFTAEEGKCYLPENMFERLRLFEGENINLRATKLNPGSFIKLQPHKMEFINNPNHKSILESNLKNYFCLTKGDTIDIKFGKKIFKVDVIECKPNKAIRILDCNPDIDLALPKDYKKPEKIKNNNISGSNINFKSNEIQEKIDKEENEKEIADKKLDEEYISNNQAKKILQAKKEKQNHKNN